MTVFRAARTLGSLSAWTLSNLPMQKTLYIAHMIHLAAASRPLFEDTFEAWEHGPAVHSLHRAVKHFGRTPIQDVFDQPVFVEGTSEARAIADAWEIARPMSAGQLVNFTHRPGGAWEQVFRADRMRIPMPNDLIRREWDPNARASDEAVEWASSMASEVESAPSRYVDFTDERSFRARVCGQNIQ